MNKKVAIVIPTFNRAGMVTRAIDTACKSDHRRDIVVWLAHSDRPVRGNCKRSEEHTSELQSR